jgi:DNA-binding transcriptional ArsR family regulator
MMHFVATPVGMLPNIAHDALAMVDYKKGPGALLLCDSEAAEARGREAVELAGLRIAGVHSIEAAQDRLDQQASVDLVLMEIDQDHEEALDSLLYRMRADAEAGLYRVVVSVPMHLIDIIDVAIGEIDTLVKLCDATLAERASSIAEVTERTAPLLHDAGRSSDRLQQLSEEASRIASALAELSEDDAIAQSRPEKSNGGAEIDVGKLRAMIRARRLRDHFFHSELFADPAWDMLLDLMAARLDGQRVAVSSLCIAAAVPATTALRWIKTLTDHGLFVRVADPQDGRRVYIELSDQAAAALENYLRAVQRLSPIAV